MTGWERATLALRLLAIDPKGLGGLVVRARVSPVRDALMVAAKGLPLPQIRLHPQTPLSALEAEIDVTATLSGATLVRQKGLLERGPSLLLLPMAERAEPHLAARLAQALDGGTGHAILALDEGAEADETLPAALADRAAFWVSLDGMGLADFTPIETIKPQSLRAIDIPQDIPEQLVQLAVSLGIHSLRAPSFALRAAQAHAALHSRDRLTSEDLIAAVDLVYTHRATQMPEDTGQNTPQEAESPPPEPQDNERQTVPDEILLEAIKAALPADLLAKLGSTHRMLGARGNGAGAKRMGNRRGRPLPPRQGSRGSGARVDLIASLRAAIPWQTIRKRAKPHRTGPIIRPSDLRHKRYQEMSDRLLIFAVDASGSAAMARLAEAKGAVELLLAEAYARRDHVALISFRGTQAEVLLPPTRSLVQTKRRLAALPGGGGTPLAAGMTEAMTLAQTACQKGLTATVILLTDGRANVTLEGAADRAQAGEDAKKVAQQMAVAGLDSLVIDTTIRPEKALKTLAEVMHGSYIALPRADAAQLSAAVSASLSG